MLKIECAGESLHLLPEKAVFWPRTGTLIIADLHLGKPAAFRRAGIAVPESTTANDLALLDRLVHATRAGRLVVLGDLFHARSGMQSEMLDTVARWRQETAQLEMILIPGNHDHKAGPPPADWNVQATGPTWSLPPFTFSHDPAARVKGYLLGGHVHPAIQLRERFGGSLRAPCFCFGLRRAILPAFGSFTGMANIQPQPGERIFAIDPAQNEVIELPVTKKCKA